MKLAHVTFNSKRPFGIELEVNRAVSQARIAELIAMSDDKGRRVSVTAWGNTISNTYWHVKTDSTCGDTGNRKDGGGYEVASFVAKGYEDLKVITKVSKTLFEGGVKVNKFCGMHIHVQIKDFNMNDAACLAANWAKIEPIMSNAVPERRRNSKYCKFFTSIFKPKKEFSVNDFWTQVQPRGYSAEDKRVALNFTNFVRSKNGYDSYDGGGRCTVELRLPEGTLDPVDVKNWVRLFVHFVSSNKKAPLPTDIKSATLEEALIILGLHSKSEFYILSSGLFETKIWFLNRILRFSLEQEIRSEVEKVLETMVEPGVESLPLKNMLPGNLYSRLMGVESK